MVWMVWLGSQLFSANNHPRQPTFRAAGRPGRPVDTPLTLPSLRPWCVAPCRIRPAPGGSAYRCDRHWPQSLAENLKTAKLSKNCKHLNHLMILFDTCWYILSNWIMLIPNWCRRCIQDVAPANDSSFQIRSAIFYHFQSIFCHTSYLSNCFPHTTCHWDVDPFVVTHGSFAAGFHVFKSTGCFLSWVLPHQKVINVITFKSCECSNSIHMQRRNAEV